MTRLEWIAERVRISRLGKDAPELIGAYQALRAEIIERERSLSGDTRLWLLDGDRNGSGLSIDHYLQTGERVPASTLPQWELVDRAEAEAEQGLTVARAGLRAQLDAEYMAGMA